MTTLSTVGYGDITPANDRERAFSIGAMLVAGVVFACAFRLPFDCHSTAIRLPLDCS